MSQPVADPKHKDFHDVLELAKDPRYKSRPLSIGVRLGLNWRYVAKVLEEHKLLKNAEMYNTRGSSSGLSENFYVS